MAGKKKLQHAYSLITSMIDQGEFEGITHFPSIASLARMAGVSVATIWRVIDLLKKEGRLVGEPGRRTSLPPRPSARHAVSLDITEGAPPRRTKTLALQQRIGRDILNGRFRHDSPLPGEKELTAGYGVSRVTLRKALLALTDQSILAHRGARFAPVPIAASPNLSRARIVLLGQGGNMGHTITYGYWHQEYLKLLETECAKARIAVDVVCFQRDSDEVRLIDGRTWLPYTLPRKDDVEGFIYEVTGEAAIDDDLLRTVTKIGRPVAILDELGVWPLPAFLRRNPNVRVFRNTVTAAPARQVARYVLELGHRTAVFISPHHQAGYSRLRLDGMQRAFAEAENARLIPVVSQFDPGRFMTQAKIAACLTEARRFTDDWVTRFPAGSFAPDQDRLIGSMRSEVAEVGFREELYRLFNRSLQIRDATVWIMVNDACAYWAVTFLADSHIPERDRPSIISFDDDPWILTKGITSYNFNQTATMIAMLRFITNPRHFPASRPVIEIEGWVVPRTTTGRARTGA